MERRRLGSDNYALIPSGLERRGILAAFTERTGGASEGPYRSLNLGFRTGDRPNRVLANRRLVTDTLGIPPFATGRQVHGARVVRVGRRRAGAGFEDPGEALERADALAVGRPGIPVAVLVADCVPVVLAGPPPEALVVVHAGWRGLAAGILTRVLRRFREPPVAAIGPAIGPCHYEVGEDVAGSVDAGSLAGAVTERRRGRTFLDLPGTAESTLTTAGVRHIERAELCTACEEERFFSHRRDGTTGRQALVAVLL